MYIYICDCRYLRWCAYIIYPETSIPPPAFSPPRQDLEGHHETAVSGDGRRTTRLVEVAINGDTMRISWE